MDLKNKVVLVTGSSRGIGLEIAKAFAQEGARIVLNARKPIESAVIKQVAELGNEVFDFSADVTDSESVETMINTIFEKFGQLDVIINNAGIVKDCLLN